MVSVPPLGKGPLQFTLTTYESKPGGNYDTGIGTAGNTNTYLIEVLLGYTNAGTFVPYNPLQLPVDIVTGASTNYYTAVVADPTVLPPANPTLPWNINSGDHFLYTIQTPPGPGARAMRARLYRTPNWGSGLVLLAEAVVPLP